MATLENFLPFDQVTALIAEAADEVPVTAFVQTFADPEVRELRPGRGARDALTAGIATSPRVRLLSTARSR